MRISYPFESLWYERYVLRVQPSSLLLVQLRVTLLEPLQAYLYVCVVRCYITVATHHTPPHSTRSTRPLLILILSIYHVGFVRCSFSLFYRARMVLKSLFSIRPIHFCDVIERFFPVAQRIISAFLYPLGMVSEQTVFLFTSFSVGVLGEEEEKRGNNPDRYYTPVVVLVPVSSRIFPRSLRYNFIYMYQ